jgi:transcriptional regulator with XRE-family HTH domain
MRQYSFATNLKRERQNLEITQKELADGVHVSQNTVSDWELCKCYPPIDKIYDIANFLKIPVSKLISDVQKNGCKADCTQKNKFF